MSSPHGKILVIRGGAIGDFILTLPALAALRQQFPDAHIEVLGYPHIVQLAVAGKLVDRVQSIEARALAGFFARDGRLEEDLADYFSEFDLIVSYLFDPDQVFRTNVSRVSQAQFIVAPHRPDESEKIHATKVYLKPLERLAIFDADPIPRLPLASQLLVAPKPGAGGSTLNSQLALHPGSGSEKKNWPEEKWATLLQTLVASSGWNFLLVGGEAEGERLQRLASNLPASRTKAAQSLPLAELAQLLGNSAAFVGHDSGISHLAAALGVPTILLWGDTLSEIWRPTNEKVVIVRKPGGLREIEVNDVVAELKQVMRGG